MFSFCAGTATGYEDSTYRLAQEETLQSLVYCRRHREGVTGVNTFRSLVQQPQDPLCLLPHG